MKSGVLVSGPGWMWVAVIVAAVGIYGWGVGHEDFWFDEVCSAAMAEHDAREILSLTADHDFHPPLYYLLLRGFRVLLGGSEWALRLPSMLGAVALVALGAGPVRRMCGDRTARLYTLLTLSTPAVLIYAHEARMYTLLMFALTACAAYGYLAVRDNRTWDWVCFGLSSLAAAYLHYYGAIAVFYAYLFLLVWLRLRRAGGRATHASPLLVTAGCVFLAYLPWVVFFLRQAMDVRRAFWIAPLDPVTVLGAICVPFATRFFYPAVPWSMVFVTGMFLIVIAFGTVFSLARKASQERVPILLAVVIFDGTLLTAIVVSLVFTPVFVPRYMLACLGPALIALSVSIRFLPVRWLRITVVSLFVVLNLHVMKDVYTQRFNGSTRELVADLRGAVEKGDLIVTSDCIAVGPVVYYLPEARHLFYLADMETMWQHYFTVFKPRIVDRSRMQELLASSESFWFVGSDSGFSVTAQDILKESGDSWEQTAGPTDYAHPYSRFTYTVSKFSRAGGT